MTNNRINGIGTGKSPALPGSRALDGISEKICAFLLVISPILQHYRGLYENAGFTVLIAVIVLLLAKLFRNGGKIRIKSEIVPLLLFELYTFFARNLSFSRFLYVGFFVLLFILISDGYVSLSLVYRYALIISVAAVLLLYVQYIFYYVFDYSLSLRPLSLLVDQDAIWIRHASSGSSSDLYRRAAFFLEPSHMFLYIFPVLAVTLLSPGITKKRIRLSILLTSGLLLSTSGFGIVASFMLWGVYFIFARPANKEEEKRTTPTGKTVSVSLIVVPVLIALLLAVFYFTIPIFRQSLDRILDLSAFDGRIRLASNYAKQISGIRMLTGKAGLINDIDFNLSGFFSTYIRWGIIGLVLTYWYYAQGLFRLKNAYFWITVIILGISYFTAHTHGTFYMLYYVMFLSMGYSLNAKKSPAAVRQ